MILEFTTKTDKSVSISELRWNSEFADIILEAIRELNHNVTDLNSQMATGICFIPDIFKFLFG